MLSHSFVVWWMLKCLPKRPKSSKSIQGKRTLSLLVENCGRVHQGRELDKQRKGDQQTIYSSFLWLLLNQLGAESILNKPILICIFPGLVGDILLNNIPLRDFTIYSLDMKPSFIDRFVCVAKPKHYISLSFSSNSLFKVNVLFQSLSGSLEDSPWKSQLPRILHGEAICIWVSKWHFCQAASEWNKTLLFILRI